MRLGQLPAAGNSDGVRQVLEHQVCDAGGQVLALHTRIPYLGFSVPEPLSSAVHAPPASSGASFSKRHMSSTCSQALMATSRRAALLSLQDPMQRTLGRVVSSPAALIHIVRAKNPSSKRGHSAEKG